MKLNYRNILLIILVSSIIGFAFNALNPNGIPVIKEERVLIFEHDDTTGLDTLNSDLTMQETKTGTEAVNSNGKNSIALELAEEVSQPFTQPIAIKLSRAYQLYKQGTIFIDSRSKEEYAEGHIKGSINIPFYESDKYDDVLNRIDKNELLVTYCSGKECDTSILHGEELFDKGYKRVYIFHGGWDDWVDAGYPVESTN
jgi:rhodanese-related sulfurtransferase